MGENESSSPRCPLKKVTNFMVAQFYKLCDTRTFLINTVISQREMFLVEQKKTPACSKITPESQAER